MTPKTTLDIQADHITPADTSGWMTKDEAATALAVSTKTIEKYVKQGKLRQEMQNQVNKPARAVLNPADVERMLSERSQNGTENTSLTVEKGSEKVLGNALERLARTIGGLPPSELSHRTVLTLDEASRLTGFGKGYLRTKMTWEKAGPRRSKVCRRTDLIGLV